MLIISQIRWSQVPTTRLGLSRRSVVRSTRVSLFSSQVTLTPRCTVGQVLRHICEEATGDVRPDARFKPISLLIRGCSYSENEGLFTFPAQERESLLIVRRCGSNPSTSDPKEAFASIILAQLAFSPSAYPIIPMPSKLRYSFLTVLHIAYPTVQHASSNMQSLPMTLPATTRIGVITKPYHLPNYVDHSGHHSTSGQPMGYRPVAESSSTKTNIRVTPRSPSPMHTHTI
jgi:hypothetical protein